MSLRKAQHFTGHFANQKHKEIMLRIVTLNLNYYIDKHGKWEDRKKIILEQLREKNPHIIAFQAVARHRDLFEGKDQARQILESLEGYKSYFYEVAQVTTDGVEQGSAVISKLPMLGRAAQKLTLLPGLDDTAQRVLLRATFARPEGKLAFYNAHFSWVAEQASLSIKEALAFLQHGGENAILAGDLNTAPDSELFQSFVDHGLVDAWRALHPDEDGYTFESDKPFTRIDYFWLTPALAKELNRLEIIVGSQTKPRLSDHLGLYMEVNFKP